MTGDDPHSDDPAATGGTSGQRLDKWLWFVRVVKTRTLAASLVTGGRVRVNRDRILKPSHSLRIGDVVTVTVGPRVRVLEMLAPGTRRGPPVEAATLFRDLTPPPEPQSAQVAKEAPAGQREGGSGRPTKRDRRLLDRLHGGGDDC